METFILLMPLLLSWFSGVESTGMFRSMTSTLLPFDTTQKNYGVAVTNVGDGQGPMEWVVAGFDGPNMVLQLDSVSGKYKNIAQPGTVYDSLRDPQGAAIGVCACDIDGDGLEEIYFLNTNDRYSGPKLVKDKLFKWRNGAYVDLFSDEQNRNVSGMFAGRSVACVDRTGNGKYGILVATYAESYRSDKKGKFGLIEMDEANPLNDVPSGQIVLRDVAVNVGIDFSTGGRGIAVGPVVGDDGFSDIYFVNEGNSRLGNRGDNALFVNDGRGGFSNKAVEMGLSDQEPGRGVTLADFNNDGLTDIAYGNWMGPHRLMMQTRDGNGGTTFQNVAQGQYAMPTPIRTVIAADFDNNGNLEVFQNNIVYYNVDASNKLFTMEPSGGGRVTVRQLDIGDAVEPDGYGTGASVADIDNDGVLELLIAHGESKAEGLSLYYVNSAANHNWIRILPLTQHGAPARGSKVTVILEQEDGTQLTRIIDGGSGYLCAMEPVAHFGLGASQPYKVKVVWPDGHHHTIRVGADDMKKTHRISPSGALTSENSVVLQGVDLASSNDAERVVVEAQLPAGNSAPLGKPHRHHQGHRRTGQRRRTSVDGKRRRTRVDGQQRRTSVDGQRHHLTSQRHQESTNERAVVSRPMSGKAESSVRSSRPERARAHGSYSYKKSPQGTRPSGSLDSNRRQQTYRWIWANGRWVLTTSPTQFWQPLPSTSRRTSTNSSAYRQVSVATQSTQRPGRRGKSQGESETGLMHSRSRTSLSQSSDRTTAPRRRYGRRYRPSSRTRYGRYYNRHHQSRPVVTPRSVRNQYHRPRGGQRSRYGYGRWRYPSAYHNTASES